MNARNNRGFGPWPEKELALDGGAWRLDPFTRIVRWVPDSRESRRDTNTVTGHLR